MNFGLIVSFGGVIIFLGKPCTVQCMAQQAMYGLGFTLCESCILTKAFRTFIAYVASDPHAQYKLEKIYKPFVIIGVLTAIQGLICIFWFVFDSPGFEEIKSKTLHLTMNRLCTQGASMVGFGFMHIYIAVLAVVCFLLAFKGRDDETDPIVFSMLIHLFAWLCFIPVFITQHELRPIIQISAIMVSNYGVMFCHFTPKWFKIISGKMEHKNALKVRGSQSRETFFHSSTSSASFGCSPDSLSSPSPTSPTPTGCVDAKIYNWDNELNVGGSEESPRLPSTASAEQITSTDRVRSDLSKVLNTNGSDNGVPISSTASTPSNARNIDCWDNGLSIDGSENSVTIPSSISTRSNTTDSDMPCWDNGFITDNSEDTAHTTTTTTNKAQCTSAGFNVPMWCHRQYTVSIRRRRTRSL